MTEVEKLKKVIKSYRTLTESMELRIQIMESLLKEKNEELRLRSPEEVEALREINEALTDRLLDIEKQIEDLRFKENVNGLLDRDCTCIAKQLKEGYLEKGDDTLKGYEDPDDILTKICDKLAILCGHSDDIDFDDKRDWDDLFYGAILSMCISREIPLKVDDANVLAFHLAGIPTEDAI